MEQSRRYPWIGTIEIRDKMSLFDEDRYINNNNKRVMKIRKEDQSLHRWQLIIFRRILKRVPI